MGPNSDKERHNRHYFSSLAATMAMSCCPIGPYLEDGFVDMRDHRPRAGRVADTVHKIARVGIERRVPLRTSFYVVGHFHVVWREYRTSRTVASKHTKLRTSQRREGYEQ